MRILLLPPAYLRRQLLSPETEQRLLALGEVISNPHEDRNLSRHEVAALLAGVDACITGWGSCRFDESVLAGADRLRLVAHAAGSVHPIASDALFARKIALTSASAGLAVSVAEHTVLVMLLALRHTIDLHNGLKSGEPWRPGGVDAVGSELRGKTIGLVGIGWVGRRMVELLRPVGVTVLAYDPYLERKEAEALGVSRVSLTELFRRSDIVSLHAAELPETRHMVGRAKLALLKDGAILINTARGSLVDEDALIDELRTGRIRAALDVFTTEPLPLDSELRRLPNVILTPHVAGNTEDSLRRLGAMAAAEVERLAAGKPLLHPVQPEMLKRLA